MMEEKSGPVKRFRLPPTYFNFSWITMVILNYTIPGYRFLSFPYTLVGILLMVPGLWMNLWASKYFNTVGTPVKPFQVSKQLVTTGFYRYSRHPMYLGMLLILVGVVLFLGSLTPILVLPFFILLINRRFISPEEAMLLDRFGEAYEEYQKRVRRWI